MTRPTSLFFALTFLLGCSAVVSIDPNELGGGAARDASAIEDGGVVEDSAMRPDMSLMCEGGCDDEVACTVDVCSDGACTHTRDNTRCGDEQRCDAEEGCVDAACEGPEDCMDEFVCNGVETCVAGLCVNGDDIVCDETSACATARCSEEAGACVYTRHDARCDDGHECTTDTCGATGCEYVPDDSVCNDGYCMMGGTCEIGMGCMGSAERVCDDGVMCTSNHCDPIVGACVFEMIDGDGDGFGPADDCGERRDCDDMNEDVYPGATEVCNSVDDDCDGVMDEGACGPPDTCDMVQVLTFGGDGTAHAEGAFAGLTDSGTACNARSRGRDAIYAIDVEANVDYVLDTTMSDGDTVLAVSDTCGAWDYAGLGCNDDAVQGQGGSRIFLRRLTAGRIFVLVDQYRPDMTPAVSFALNVVSFPSPAEACAASPEITLGGTVVGRLRRGSPHTSSCGGPDSEREASFRARVRGTAQGYSEDFDVDIYLRGSCTGTPHSCENDGGPIEVSSGGGPFETDTILTIDGAGRDGGLYSLQYQPRRTGG